MTAIRSLPRGTDPSHYELKYYDFVIFEFVADDLGNCATTATTAVAS